MANHQVGEVIQVIEQALELKPGSIEESSEADEFQAWDSLGQLNILSGLDVLFEGKILGIGEMASANSVPKILALLRQNSLI